MEGSISYVFAHWNDVREGGELKQHGLVGKHCSHLGTFFAVSTISFDEQRTSNTII